MAWVTKSLPPVLMPSSAWACPGQITANTKRLRCSSLSWTRDPKWRSRTRTALLTMGKNGNYAIPESTIAHPIHPSVLYPIYPTLHALRSMHYSLCTLSCALNVYIQCTMYLLLCTVHYATATTYYVIKCFIQNTIYYALTLCTKCEIL